MRRAARDFFDFDHGFLGTALLLLTQPARVTRDYIAGRTVRYLSPIKYFLITLTLAQLVSWQLGIMQDFVAGFMEGTEISLSTGAGAELLARYFVLVAAPVVVILTLLARLFFRRAGFNVAELLVFFLFTFGQLCLIFAVFGAALIVLPRSIIDAISIIILLLQLAYFIAATRSTFGLSRIAGTLRVLLLALLASILYLPLMFGFASLAAAL